MKLHVAWIGKTRQKPVQALTAEYLERIARYASVSQHELRDEAALLALAEKLRATLLLLDSRGRQVSSEELAGLLGEHQVRGTQALLFAVGPADGFSDPSRRLASEMLGFGRITLPHELARVVLLEQLYRAFTILKSHPYHGGH